LDDDPDGQDRLSQDIDNWLPTPYSNPAVVGIVFCKGHPFFLTRGGGKSIKKAVGLSDLEARVGLEIISHICIASLVG
jgi:hypothetical protein